MNPRMLIVGVLAVVCGLSAVFLVQALRKPSAPPVEKTGVVYMAADVRPGESIAEAMLELREVPVGEVPEDAIRKTADAVDRAALAQLDKGDLLRARKLAERGVGRGVASLIRPGMRAFTIQTPSFSSSLAGLLLPGNRVDVLLTANSSGGPSGGAMTTTLLHNVEILAIHNTVNAPTSNKINPEDARSVTLQVTPQDVELLDLGQNKGTLHLSLRNPKDERPTQDKPMALADLRRFPPDADPALAATKVPTPATPESLASRIRPGMRAVTIPTSSSSSIAGMLVPGNRVDVLIGARADAKSSGGSMTATLLHNVEVLAVATNAAGAPGPNPTAAGVAGSVTVQVKPDDVEKLNLGQIKGTLHLSLRNPRDEAYDNDSLMTLADLERFPEGPPDSAGPAPVKLTIRTLRGTSFGADTLTVIDHGPSSGLDTARLSAARPIRRGR